jgi:hypothetical protein
MQDRNNIVKIKIPDTKFWVLGEQKTDTTWDVYIIDPDKNTKELIKEDATTKSFATFSGVVLKTPFPYAEE